MLYYVVPFLSVDAAFACVLAARLAEGSDVMANGSLLIAVGCAAVYSLLVGLRKFKNC